MMIINTAQLHEIVIVVIMIIDDRATIGNKHNLSDTSIIEVTIIRVRTRIRI